MKLWQKEKGVDELVEKFTIGQDSELDLLLAPYDVLGSLAHTQMLASIDLLTAQEFADIERELKEIYKVAISGGFVIDDGVEDVHSQVEMMLIAKLGDTGKKIHSGRSRNDQVLVDLKLFMRSELEELVKKTSSLFELLQKLSEEHKQKLMPGYTHMQIAMPSSLGLWFGAYAEALVDDLIQIHGAFKIVNKNPLGSAAGYGSSFPLDRQMTTDLLGFETLNYNVVYAQMTRGRAEKAVSNALASVGSTLAKLSMDVCMYMGQNFGFFSFPDELTTGSSIMPHKKNPDVFELIRAKSNKIQALPIELNHILNNLPSGYHRDLQILKESFFPAFQTINDCLEMTQLMLSNIKISDGILDDEKYDYLFSVELVNKFVLEGLPFRDAYKKVGSMIESGEYQPSKSVTHTSLGTIGNLATEHVKMQFNKTIDDFGFERINETLDSLISE